MRPIIELMSGFSDKYVRVYIDNISWVQMGFVKDTKYQRLSIINWIFISTEYCFRNSILITSNNDKKKKKKFSDTGKYIYINIKKQQY